VYEYLFWPGQRYLGYRVLAEAKPFPLPLSKLKLFQLSISTGLPPPTFQLKILTSQLENIIIILSKLKGMVSRDWGGLLVVLLV
jgi:hypothetical protein